MIKKINLLIISALLAAAGCGGSAISDAQNFVPNNPPEITDIVFTTPDGSAVDPAYLVPGKVIKFRVAAADPDGDALTYSFSSQTGSFYTQTVNGNLCTVDFVIGGISGGQEVRVDISIDDGRGGKVSTYRSPGSSSEKPEITISGRNYIMPSEPAVNITLKADRNGYFQVVRQETLLPVPAFNENEAAYYFNYGTTGGLKDITVSGNAASTPGRIVLADNNKKYYLYIIFRDLLNQSVTAVHEMTADNVTPGIIFSPAAGKIKYSDPITLTFSEPVQSYKLSGSFIDGAYTITENLTANTVTLTPINNWPMSASGLDPKSFEVTCTDRAGNDSIAASFSRIVYTDTVYVHKNGSDTANNGLQNSPYLTVQKGIDYLIDSTTGVLDTGETGTVCVAGGVYSSSDKPVAAIDGTYGNIRLMGGYSEANWNLREPDTYITTLRKTIDPVIQYAVKISYANSSTKIDGFTIVCDSDGDSPIGIYVESGEPVISNNHINFPAASRIESTGIYYSYNGHTVTNSPVISNNYINISSTNSATSTGIFFSYTGTSATGSPEIFNNIIKGGTAVNNTFGIRFHGADSSNAVNPVIRNNTINAGFSTESTATAMVFDCDFGDVFIPVIENNILTKDSAAGVAIYFNFYLSIPSIRNNNFYNFGLALSNKADTDYNITDLNEQAYAQGTNKGVDMTSFFLEGMHLASDTPVSIKSGGIDGAAKGWSFTTDADGNSRTGNGTTGWSIGAFEHD